MNIEKPKIRCTCSTVLVSLFFSSSAAFIWNGIAQNTLTTIRKRAVFYAFCYTSESVYIQGNGKYEPFLGHEHE